MEQPQEVVEDEEHERAWGRVAAIDVAKASGVVCTRVPDEDRPGRRRARVWTVAATMGDVTTLGDHLRCQGVEVVTIEPTSDYWRIWHAVLEAAGGLKVQLVNARAVKNVPGRAKTDKKEPSGWPSLPSGACSSPRSSRTATSAGFAKRKASSTIALPAVARLDEITGCGRVAACPQKVVFTGQQRSIPPGHQQGHDLSSGLKTRELIVLTCWRPPYSESAG
jgi:hypothetical protein